MKHLRSGSTAHHLERSSNAFEMLTNFICTGAGCCIYSEWPGLHWKVRTRRGKLLVISLLIVWMTQKIGSVGRISQIWCLTQRHIFLWFGIWMMVLLKVASKCLLGSRPWSLQIIINDVWQTQLRSIHAWYVWDDGVYWGVSSLIL